MSPREPQLARRPGPTGGAVVQAVRVELDRVAEERLAPPVSVLSGERPARPEPVNARTTPWWPWLLLLAGWVGALIVVVFYPRMCRQRTIWVPISAGDHRRARARATRWVWATVCALGVLAALAVTGVVGPVQMPPGFTIPLGLTAGVAALWCQRRARDTAPKVRARLDDDEAVVVLRRVAVEYVHHLEAG